MSVYFLRHQWEKFNYVLKPTQIVFQFFLKRSSHRQGRHVEKRTVSGFEIRRGCFKCSNLLSVSCSHGQEYKLSWIEVFLSMKLSFIPAKFFPRVFVGLKWDNVYMPAFFFYLYFISARHRPRCWVPTDAGDVGLVFHSHPFLWAQRNNSTVQYRIRSSEIESNMVHLERQTETSFSHQ